MPVAAALDEVRGAPFLLDAIRLSDRVLDAAAVPDRHAVEVLERAVMDPSDHVTSIAAVHALGRVLDDGADAVLSELLSHDEAFLREHASWALAARLPRLDAVGRLVDVVAAGGFAGMLAQRTLQRWSGSAPEHVAVALDAAANVVDGADARTRLVETLGLVPGQVSSARLRAVARDRSATSGERHAAIAALGDRRDITTVEPLTALDDPELRAAAELALIDAGMGRASVDDAVRADGLRVVQMFLHADLDASLARVGTGDTGGLATLLIRLGDALAQRPEVEGVMTLSRGSAVRAHRSIGDRRAGHRLLPVPLGPAVPAAPPMSEAWPARVAVERALRRLLRTLGPVDAFHVRMADVGALAAHAVARDAGVPLVFTVAPDPHALVHALDTTGSLTRADFGPVDAADHHWFRIRLVSRLLADSDHAVLFPRPDLRGDLRRFLGVDVDEPTRRFTVVPEGIDVEVSERADAELSGGVAAPALELDRLIQALPAHRHGLPVVTSVGRLQRVKGMATVVEAWAGDAELRSRCNLVIVGGDLERPDPREREQLDRIRAVLARVPEAAEGVVLAGHRPHDTVSGWLAAVRGGTPSGLVGAAGAYVCGSLKEEFGLAVLEAMAAGNVVVVPDAGGPATYVEAGRHGVLVDTRDPAEVAAGIAAALDMAQRPGVADAVRRVVHDGFTIMAMADSLVDVYRDVSASPVGASPRPSRTIEDRLPDERAAVGRVR